MNSDDENISKLECAHFLYRDKYRRLMFYLIALVLSTLSLLLIFFFEMALTPKPRYFATTSTGDTQLLHSLDMPIVTQHYLLQWATGAVRACYNLNFNTYQQNLKKASLYFTDAGWASFMAAMKQSGVIDVLLQKKLIMSAIVDGPGIILAEEIVHGRYTWQVQLPLSVTYGSASEGKHKRLIVTMNIVRIPVVETRGSNQQTPEGIQINNFFVSAL